MEKLLPGLHSALSSPHLAAAHGVLVGPSSAWGCWHILVMPMGKAKAGQILEILG